MKYIYLVESGEYDDLNVRVAFNSEDCANKFFSKRYGSWKPDELYGDDKIKRGAHKDYGTWALITKVRLR